MAEDRQADAQTHRRRWPPEGFRGQTALALAIFAVLVVIFHRPILLTVGRKIALQYAAKENLKADFRLEGNPFSHLTIRNFHAFAVG
ncbi:MAG: hypothetical protein DME54_00490, partial [Verrucomicrobia bacterium]